MIHIIKKEELSNSYDGARVNGYLLMRGYTKQPTKNGGEYISGSIEVCGAMGFKSWGNSAAFATLSTSGTEYQNKICHVSADVNIYGGVMSLIIQSISLADPETLKEEGISERDFLSSTYDVDVYWKEFESTFKRNTTEKAHDIFDGIFSGIVKEKFLSEFAAVSHHDNCMGGLLAHTTKVVKVATILKMYPNIYKRVGKDLLFLGAALHDIGKITEYNNGVVSDHGKIMSHTVSGVMFLERHCRNLIISNMSEEFYNRLVSVVSCHHGEYGEPPRTVEAYAIHLVDCLESNLTSVNQLLEGVAVDQQIVIEGMKLS